MTSRLQSVLAHLQPDSLTGNNMNKEEPEKPLPSFDELPKYRNFVGCAWDVWGPNDQLGTINLLTEGVVKRGAQEEVRTGKTVALNWPINFPAKPFFNRKAPEHRTWMKAFTVRDDELHINTQSGTQWDGMKHFPLIEHEMCYGGVPARSLPDGQISFNGPGTVDPELIKLGIHNWAQHGICGRGVLLDLVGFQSSQVSSSTTSPFSPPSALANLPYDPWTSHPIQVSELLACAQSQGVTFRRGDILLIRMGFIRRFEEASVEERERLSEIEVHGGIGAGKGEQFAGIEQSEEMKRFLWDNHFAAVASDQPTLERWPTPEGVPHMHQTLLGLWGMPIGEFFDLEALSDICASTKRYTFFFSSWPLNVLGGVGSPPNAAAYF
ncbi:uncharacterized protein STEHIDRAFT_102776 [Stereum hirsutum FP-91666 SS1]|uniref:uncharacterized protein n=1 Tax=Stereum hirsutum (strain FP-91666) TaxID=721885 RepID=UPI0004449E85|nr:uncharacterized protein STEHIDRAFT_102776 [Stereum hirsutum FP-91666 SS1]EIM82290.1 hypothetical protein STEHIDRAFT_102776 [Stereum hirsutum FP-91666 SS1]